MKILGIVNNYGECTEHRQALLMADSSLLKDSKPFFLPAFDQEFRMYPSLVIRVCRLGKNIARRFAHRYYDAYALGLNVRAVNMLQSLQNEHLPWAEAVAFDSSAIMGDFETIESAEQLTDLSFEVRQNDTVVATWDISRLATDIDTLIEDISRRFTLKIGDFIYIGFAPEGIVCHIDDAISATDSRDKARLNFKIK